MYITKQNLNGSTVLETKWNWFPFFLWHCKGKDVSCFDKLNPSLYIKAKWSNTIDMYMQTSALIGLLLHNMIKVSAVLYSMALNMVIFTIKKY